jgi:hypothetical protein
MLRPSAARGREAGWSTCPVFGTSGVIEEATQRKSREAICCRRSSQRQHLMKSTCVSGRRPPPGSTWRACRRGIMPHHAHIGERSAWCSDCGCKWTAWRKSGELWCLCTCPARGRVARSCGSRRNRASRDRKPPRPLSLQQTMRCGLASSACAPMSSQKRRRAGAHPVGARHGRRRPCWHPCVVHAPFRATPCSTMCSMVRLRTPRLPAPRTVHARAAQTHHTTRR